MSDSKVFVRQDGSEYLLLENRRKQGFDSNLPSEGLLIWRIVGKRPMLEESHGIEGPAGPSAFRDLVPYPTRANDSFTPYTIPSSRSQLGGGLPIHLTNILRWLRVRVTREQSALRSSAISKNRPFFGPVFWPNRNIALGGAAFALTAPKRQTIAANTAFNIRAPRHMSVFLTDLPSTTSIKTLNSRYKKTTPKC